KLRLPQNDNNVFGVLSSGFLGGSDSTVNNGYGFLSPAQSFSIHTFQNIDHFTGSLQANYRPLNWLEAHAVIGTDFLSRYDDNTSFGKRFGNILYPRLSMSWVASEEPFFPKPGWLGALKLRAAYGSSGLHPGPTDALQFFNPTPVVINNTDVPGITIGSLGNAALKPERTNETEAGFDAELRPLSARIAFTYYSKLSHDALIAVTLPPSCGCGTSIFRNLGSVSNKGVEIWAAATVIHFRNLNVDLNLGAWGTRIRVR